MRVPTTFVNTENFNFIDNCNGLCYECDKYGSRKCDSGYGANVIDKHFNNIDMALESKRVRR